MAKYELCADSSRRRFLTGALAVAAAAPAWSQELPAIPIIDAHVHLFDPRRPQGVPYSGPKGQPPQLALPDLYDGLSAPAGIVGAIAVEASPWVEDNLWLLERAESDPTFVGVIGNLRPDSPDFPAFLERFSKNPLWRGLRYGRVWVTENGEQALKPGIVEGLKRLSDAGQVLEMANPTMEMLRAALMLCRQLPQLTVVMDHMPSLDPAPEEQSEYDKLLDDLAACPAFCIKLSQVIHHNRADGLDAGLAAHKARLDQLMAAFGDNRVLFGSDWPNSVGTATIPQAVALMRNYFASKPVAAAENYFWRNSRRIYRWLPRRPNQPG